MLDFPKVISAVAAVLMSAAVGCGSARANLVIDIAQIDANHYSISGSGSIPNVTVPDPFTGGIALLGALGGSGLLSHVPAGNLAIGGEVLDFAGGFSTTDLLLCFAGCFSTSLNIGDAMTGSSTLVDNNNTGTAFAGIGSSGQILWAGAGTPGGVIGTWSIVPLPAALPLFLSALGGVWGLGRLRRRRAAGMVPAGA